MIQFINVSKAYKQHNVLENINLSINEGELVVLIGPSGCGKNYAAEDDQPSDRPYVRTDTDQRNGYYCTGPDRTAQKYGLRYPTDRPVRTYDGTRKYRDRSASGQAAAG